MGRLGEFETGAVEDPSLGSESTPSTDPSASAQTPASAPAGPETAPAGQPGEATPTATQVATPANPPAAAPATAAPSAPAPAPTQPTTEQPQTPPATEPPAVAPPATPAEPQLSVEEVLANARREGAEEVEGKWRARQSGQDRRMNDMERKLEASAEREEVQVQRTRESMLTREGLTDAERQTLQKTWELEDKERKLNEFSATTLDLHADTEVALLIFEYRGVPGITEEALQALPQEERTDFCKDKKIEFLESGGKPAAPMNGNTQLAPAQAPAPAAAPAAVPAGVNAPSDVGGAGVPSPVPKNNEEKSSGAMAENIAGNGWREVNFGPGR